MDPGRDVRMELTAEQKQRLWRAIKWAEGRARLCEHRIERYQLTGRMRESYEGAADYYWIMVEALTEHYRRTKRI